MLPLTEDGQRVALSTKKLCCCEASLAPILKDTAFIRVQLLVYSEMSCAPQTLIKTKNYDKIFPVEVNHCSFTANVNWTGP